MKVSRKGIVRLFIDDDKWVGCELEIPHRTHHIAAGVDVEVEGVFSVNPSPPNKPNMDAYFSSPIRSNYYTSATTSSIKMSFSYLYSHWGEFTSTFRNELGKHFRVGYFNVMLKGYGWDAFFDFGFDDHVLNLKHYNEIPSGDPSTLMWRWHGSITYGFNIKVYTFLYRHTSLREVKKRIRSACNVLIGKLCEVVNSLLSNEHYVLLLCDEAFKIVHGVPWHYIVMDNSPNVISTSVTTSNTIFSGNTVSSGSTISSGVTSSGVNTLNYHHTGCWTSFVTTNKGSPPVTVTLNSFRVISERVRKPTISFSHNHTPVQQEITPPFSIAPSILKVIKGRWVRVGKPMELSVNDMKVKRYFLSVASVLPNISPAFIRYWNNIGDRFDLIVVFAEGNSP